MHFVRRFGVALCAILVAVAVVVVEVPSAGAAPSAVAGRVIPLPEGMFRWSTAYGVAGPMWSSGHHTGLDFGAATGTPILAAADGTVIFTGNGGAYGNLTQIQHEEDVQTWYAHQSAIAVSVGTAVKAGDIIGAVGSTGNSTGPHLHFEVRIGGGHVDPAAWLSGAPTVPSDGTVFDPALAAQLRGELAEAEAVQEAAHQRVKDIESELETLRSRSARKEKAARAAHQQLVQYVRTVYKMGVDPQWLINMEAFDAGDWRTFSDQQVVSEYTANARTNELDRAFAVMADARAHERKIEELQNEATATLSEATAKMADLQSKLAASGGGLIAGTQFDGVVPDGASPEATAAARAALGLVGKKFSATQATGPEKYSDVGVIWRAWQRAGTELPLVPAHKLASDRQALAPIKAGAEKPGDLVFWRKRGSQRINHVGIVVNPEQGLFVHASSPRTGIEVNNYVSSTYYRDVALFVRVRPAG